MSATITHTHRFNTGIAIYFVLMHIAALLALAPFAFSWSAVAVMIFLHWLTASIGICLGFHRYLTHRGMKLPKWLGYFVVFCGSLACQNGPIKWVAQHRMHHAGSDTERDPHSAKKGFWWAHYKWMLYTHPVFDDEKTIYNYTKDFSDDKFYRFLDNHFIKIQFVLGFILFAIGGLPWVVWGIFVRLVLVYHSTWFVNSAAHYFGYKTFTLENDLSTNCWWVGLIAYGEGWHNNHHAVPKSARHGLRPWEIDLTWMSICVLKFLGLATDIKVAKLIRIPASESASAKKGYAAEMVRQAA
ncbi:MAG: acyl-CoA desaturase [Nitrospinaceae bacterium]